MAIKRKPEWMRVRLSDPGKLNRVNALIEELSLNTVCKEANCPNRLECYSKKTATFMILGSTCSRNCKFCNVENGTLLKPDPEEPKKVAEAVKALELRHAVITSVTRDDLTDGGAAQFVQVIEEIRNADNTIIVEVLIPDLQGNKVALKSIVDAAPDVLNHNIETVPRLYDTVRPEANYIQSLEVIRNVKAMNPKMLTKSGIMLGLGETEEEVRQVLRDLREYGCNLLTIGQYLQPSEKHIEMVEYIHPDIFDKYKKFAEELGFDFVASAPMVRSSYNAAEFLSQTKC